MKKLILLLLLILNSSVWTQEYVMNVKKSDGSTVSFPVSEINKITFDDILGIKSDRVNDILKTFTLFQNYPNPFNPSTTIKYDIPKSGRVHVTIYNVLGQEVRSLLDGRQEAGTHTITWHGDNNTGDKVASGMYIYRVDFQGQNLVKKMLLLK